MSVVPTHPRSADRTVLVRIAERDGSIDAVRALSLLVVVMLHALMAGAGRAPDGGLTASVAMAGEGWFVPVSWVVQVMPLFFIAGGFAGLHQWRRMQGRGDSAVDYVRVRAMRLILPAAVMIGLSGLVLAGASAAGADGELVAEAGRRITQPLWFLAVYLGVTSLVPVMARLHERHRALTLAVLAAAVLGTDLLRMHTDLPVGYLGLGLVWPLMQQIGFLMHDGACAPRSAGGRWTPAMLLTGAGLATGGLAALVSCGWPADMLVNLNPPTAALALLGVVQFFLLQLARPALDRWMRRPRPARAVRAAGAHAMTVYLWHMPVVLLLVAVLWVTGMPLPDPHTAAWWATRLPWLAAVCALVVPAALLLAGIERGSRRAQAGRAAAPGARLAARTALAVLCGIAGVTLALLAGAADLPAVICAVALLAAGAGLSAGRGR
ncbi:acyltransferase [Brevibacterium salitolerans]|uniref:Acyltransferase 3 domain-containing protein n=1 Tax=Brevibacterium salitolerans TaxID=1403566 RepID=A0ABN2W8Z4_9MICO